MSENEQNPGRFLRFAVLLAATFTVLAFRFALLHPQPPESGALGNIAELNDWQEGEPLPAMSGGPLYFYLLRAAARCGLRGTDLAVVDRLFAGLFLLFYALFVRQVFGPWIALGSAGALLLHPFMLLNAAWTSGLFPYFAFLFLGFWRFATLLDRETRPSLSQWATAGFLLSPAMFIRTEAFFFIALLYLAASRYEGKKAFRGIFLGMAAAGTLFFGLTSVSPIAFFVASGSIISNFPEAAEAQFPTFLRYLTGAFGLIPMLAALTGAFWSLGDRRMRPWSLVLLGYACFVALFYLEGRFPYDQERFYLFLLPICLPFFGWTVVSLLHNRRPQTRAITIMLLYGICVVAYAIFTWRFLALHGSALLTGG